MKEIMKAIGRTVFKTPLGFLVTFKYIFKKPVTLDYPRKKKPMAPRYKGKHYLERYDDGTERCVCCGLCAAACPADAIYMEPLHILRFLRGSLPRGSHLPGPGIRILRL